MEYVFRSGNGCCPQCIAFGKVYFIQDRYIGGEKYEYALMSRDIEKKDSKHFSDIKELVSFLVDSEITDDIAANLLLNQITLYQCASLRMIEKNGVKYVWDNLNNKLREYIEPRQETGYCNTYLECLNMAKEILDKKEQENNGMQVSLFN